MVGFYYHHVPEVYVWSMGLYGKLFKIVGSGRIRHVTEDIS